MEYLLASGLLFVILGIVFFWNLLIAYMARRRGRSGLGWFILSFLIDPIIAMIILICIGDR